MLVVNLHMLERRAWGESLENVALSAKARHRRFVLNFLFACGGQSIPAQAMLSSYGLPFWGHIGTIFRALIYSSKFRLNTCHPVTDVSLPCTHRSGAGPSETKARGVPLWYLSNGCRALISWRAGRSPCLQTMDLLGALPFPTAAGGGRLRTARPILSLLSPTSRFTRTRRQRWARQAGEAVDCSPFLARCTVSSLTPPRPPPLTVGDLQGMTKGWRFRGFKRRPTCPAWP